MVGKGYLLILIYNSDYLTKLSWCCFHLHKQCRQSVGSGYELKANRWNDLTTNLLYWNTVVNQSINSWLIIKYFSERRSRTNVLSEDTDTLDMFVNNYKTSLRCRTCLVCLVCLRDVSPANASSLLRNLRRFCPVDKRHLTLGTLWTTILFLFSFISSIIW